MKYPRTPHLPASPGISEDDIANTVDPLLGRLVVVTEKLDGECTCISRAEIHARSENRSNHPSRAMVKNLWGTISYLIDEDVCVYGENMYAKHSIEYTLDNVFYVFAVRKGSKFLSWNEVKATATKLGLQCVPVLYEGLWQGEMTVPATSKYGPDIEGYVVRNEAAFVAEEFDKNVAKWVRKDHVTTDRHWRNNWVPNKIV